MYDSQNAATLKNTGGVNYYENFNYIPEAPRDDFYDD